MRLGIEGLHYLLQAFDLVAAPQLLRQLAIDVGRQHVQVVDAAFQLLDELQARAASPNGFVSRHARMILQNWPGPADQPPDYQYPIQVFRLGGTLTLVALAGEPMVDYSLQLKQLLQHDQQSVWIAGYSNLVNAYIPNRRVLQEGEPLDERLVARQQPEREPRAGLGGGRGGLARVHLLALHPILGQLCCSGLHGDHTSDDGNTQKITITMLDWSNERYRSARGGPSRSRARL